MSVDIVAILLSIIILSMFSLAFTGIKIVIHNFLDYPRYEYLWVKYFIFYTLAFGIRIGFSFFIDSNHIYSWIIILGIALIEILIFYKRYYNLESKKRYAMFLLFSTIFGGMAITTLFAFLLTFAVIII